MIRLKAFIDWNWVEKELLSKERASSSKEISKHAHAVLKAANRLCKARIASSELKLTCTDGGRIKLNDGTTLHTFKISEFLKGAESLMVIAATIGPGLESEATKLMGKGDPLSGYLLDRAGSYAVESLAQVFEDALRKEMAREKKSVSARFSPGYCDWAVEEQRKIMEITRASRIGIRLTESFMMSPKKSITAIMGIGRAGLFKKNFSQCDICGMIECSYRR